MTYHITQEGPKNCKATNASNCPYQSAIDDTGYDAHEDNLQHAQYIHEEAMKIRHNGSTTSLSKTGRIRNKFKSKNAKESERIQAIARAMNSVTQAKTNAFTKKDLQAMNATYPKDAGRWCETCQQHGSHHTDNHEDFAKNVNKNTEGVFTDPQEVSLSEEEKFQQIIDKREDEYQKRDAKEKEDSISSVSELIELKRKGYFVGGDSEGTPRDWTAGESAELKQSFRAGEHQEDIQKWFPAETQEAEDEMKKDRADNVASSQKPRIEKHSSLSEIMYLREIGYLNEPKNEKRPDRTWTRRESSMIKNAYKESKMDSRKRLRKLFPNESDKADYELQEEFMEKRQYETWVENKKQDFEDEGIPYTDDDLSQERYSDELVAEGEAVADALYE